MGTLKINNFSPITIKFDGDSTDGYSVLVKDENSEFEAWVDVYVLDGDIITDWNKQIFYLNNEKDIFQKNMQDDAYIFELCTSISVQFLEENNKVKQNESGIWHYLTTNI